MNLHISGQHLSVTPPIRDYMLSKLDRVSRHYDHLLDVSVVMTVEKQRQKVEANLHVAGREFHAESVQGDLYAAIDELADRLDRQVVKHKERKSEHRGQSADPVKRMVH